MKTESRFRSTLGLVVTWVAAFAVTIATGLSVTPIAMAQKQQESENEDDGGLLVTGPEVAPVQDDAELHAVVCRPNGRCWAVGDHGVIWRSDDFGRSWRFQTSGTTASLTAVQFPTDEVGFAAGGGLTPYSTVSQGVLLKTTNGGRTWQSLPAKLASRLVAFRFFDPENGILVCTPSITCPTGVSTTSNGGESWNPVLGERGANWRTALFPSPDVAILGGTGAAVSSLSDGRVSPTRTLGDGSRTLHAITLDSQTRAWMVGDGGLVLQSTNGGTSWQSPPTEPGEITKRMCRFRGVACRGNAVCIVGQPGSCVWRSEDAGRNWIIHKTGQSLPLNAIDFADDDQGCAVGCMGTIIVTSDGGRSWKSSRGTRRRAAYLGVWPRSSGTPVGVVASLSGEHGYRGVCYSVARDDLGPVAAGGDDAEYRLHQAMMYSHGNASEVNWNLLAPFPELQTDVERLTHYWNTRTDSKLGEELVEHLTVQLRMWCPSVVLLNEPAETDAVERIVFDAMQKAVESSADGTRYLEHADVLGLSPWKVERVFVRLPAGSKGGIVFSPDDYLPRLGCSTFQAASAASSVLTGTTPSPEADSFRLHSVRDNMAKLGARTLFGGLAIPADSPARRPLKRVEPDVNGDRLKRAQKQRNFRVIAQKSMSNWSDASRLIAGIEPLLRDTPDREAALQLLELAEAQAAAGHLDLAESVYLELVARHADQPAAVAAVEWLTPYWCSQETNWRRFRGERNEETKINRALPIEMVARVNAALARMQQQTVAAQEGEILVDDLSDEAPPAPGIAAETIPENVSRFDARLNFWRRRAARLAGVVALQPQIVQSPTVLTPLLAVQRSHTDWPDLERALATLEFQPAARPRSDTGHSSDTGPRSDTEGSANSESSDESDAVRQASVTDLEDSSADETTAVGSSGETLSPEQLAALFAGPNRKLVKCRFTDIRPRLDGVLSDPCWQAADELPLEAAPGDASLPEHPFAMLAFDSRFLYFAGLFPRLPGTRTEGALRGRREHDADVTGFDRVLLRLDTDRDFVTAYDFTIDQRGCTRDALWTDASWNPKWFVAVEAEEGAYRIEAAIPWRELGPRAPQSGETWGINLVRVIPGAAVQSWTKPPRVAATPDSFGLLQFE